MLTVHPPLWLSPIIWSWLLKCLPQCIRFVGTCLPCATSPDGSPVFCNQNFPCPFLNWTELKRLSQIIILQVWHWANYSPVDPKYWNKLATARCHASGRQTGLNHEWRFGCTMFSAAETIWDLFYHNHWLWNKQDEDSPSSHLPEKARAWNILAFRSLFWLQST